MTLLLVLNLTSINKLYQTRGSSINVHVGRRRLLEVSGLRKYFFIHQELKATYTNSLRPPKLGTLKLSPFACSETLSHGTVANERPRRFIDNSKFKVSDNTLKVHD